MIHFIFDLDGTTIDSSHRQLAKADGSLDLAHWIENSKPEKVMQDKLLPLGKEWRMLAASGFPIKVIVCTARVMGAADFQYLEDHGLHYDVCLSRVCGDTTPDEDMKELKLRQLARDLNLSWARFCHSAIMFDDNPTTVKRMNDIGISCQFPKVA
jgi:hypothetical protein